MKSKMKRFKEWWCDETDPGERFFVAFLVTVVLCGSIWIYHLISKENTRLDQAERGRFTWVQQGGDQLSVYRIHDSSTGREYLAVYHVGLIELPPTKPEAQQK